MNLVPNAPAWLLAILFAALAAAAVEDFVRRKISNITCAVVFVAALLAMAMHGLSLDLWQNAVVFAVLLVVGTLLFAADKIGGGDVKLFAATGLWTNIGAGVWLVSTALLAGGVIALIYLIIRYMRGGSKTKGIPYGLAIVAGAGIIFAGQLGLLKARPSAADQLMTMPVR